MMYRLLEKEYARTMAKELMIADALDDLIKSGTLVLHTTGG
jgi:hypothetical protein